MKKSEYGFSLIELLMVLGIIAVILVIAVPKFTQYMKEKSYKSELSKVIDLFDEARLKAIDLKKSALVHFHHGQLNDANTDQLNFFIHSKDFIFQHISKVEFDLTGRVRYDPTLKCVDVIHVQYPQLKIKFMVNPLGEYKFVTNNEGCIA